MKKTTIILTLCMLVSLASCGKADTVEDSKPLNIQKATVSTTVTKESQEYESPFKNHSSGNSEPQVTGTATEDIADNGSFTFPVTTVKTGAAVLVKRTGIAAPNIPPSRGNVVIPYASNIVRTTKTTIAKNTVTTINNTSIKKTGTTVSTGTNTVTTAATTTSLFEIAHNDNLFKIQNNGIEIIRKEKVVQLIEIDMKSILDECQNKTANLSSLITLKDYDFDGYDDLYIKQDGFSTPNPQGIYMHYNPETEKFETWEQMSDIKTIIWVDEENHKLNTSVSGSAVDHESWTYIWNEDKQLQLIGSLLQYAVEEDVFIDYFEYPDGEKTLVRREQIILDDEHNIIDTTEIPLVQDPTEVPTEATTEEPTETTTEETTE